MTPDSPKTIRLASLLGQVSRDQIRNDPLPIEEFPGMEIFSDQVIDIISSETSSFQRFDLDPSRSNTHVAYDLVCALIPCQTKREKNEGSVSIAYIIFTPPGGDETSITTPNFRKKILAQKRMKMKEMKKRWPNANFDRDQDTPKEFLLKNVDKPIAVIGYSRSDQGETISVFCPIGKSPDWAIGNFRNVIIQAA